MKNDDGRAKGSRKPLGKTRNKLFNLNIIKIDMDRTLTNLFVEN